MYCRKCGKLVPEGARFCRYCGTELGESAGSSQVTVDMRRGERLVFCPKCGSKVRSSAQFCPYCGITRKSDGSSPGYNGGYPSAGATQRYSGGASSGRNNQGYNRGDSPRENNQGYSSGYSSGGANSGNGYGRNQNGGKRNGGKKALLIAAIVALVCVAGGVGGFFLLGSRSDSDNSKTGSGTPESETLTQENQTDTETETTTSQESQTGSESETPLSQESQTGSESETPLSQESQTGSESETPLSQGSQAETDQNPVGTGAESETGQGSTPEEAYQEILSLYKQGLSEGWDGTQFSNADLNYMSYYYDETKLGYLFRNLNGDGIQDLLIGEVEQRESYKGMFFDLYTLSDGAPVLVERSRERDRYYLCEDGRISNEGSGGAALSFFSWYSFDPGKTELTFQGALEYNSETGATVISYSTTSMESGYTQISEQEAQELSNSLVTTYLDFQPFSGYASGGNNTAATESNTEKKGADEAIGSDEDEAASVTLDGSLFADGQPVSSSTGYILPDSGSRYLSESDLSNLSLKGICYAKNEIYAKHHRKFVSAELNAYFASTQWYSGEIEPADFTESMVQSVFNEYEKANVRLLAQVEESRGTYQLDQ